jgi:CRISPR-associated protein Csb3
MTHPEPNITVNVDVTNPGQFFACCGLLELADRLWPGAEGWFAGGEFCLGKEIRTNTAGDLIRSICEIPEMSEKTTKNSALGSSKSKIKPIALSFPYKPLLIDWWQDSTRMPGKASKEATASSVFKTWAGQQSPQQIVFDNLMPALRKVMGHNDNDWFHSQISLSGRFGFDYRASVKPIDVGWSPDKQSVSVGTSPAIELLAMIGLQRFRPQRIDRSFNFCYCTWDIPLPCLVAPAYSSATILAHGSQRYCFSIEKRGDYKFFTIATPQGALQ